MSWPLEHQIQEQNGGSIGLVFEQMCIAANNSQPLIFLITSAEDELRQMIQRELQKQKAASSSTQEPAGVSPVSPNIRKLIAHAMLEVAS